MAAALLVATLGAIADGATVFTADSLCRVLDERPLHDVEGLWQLTADGATVAILLTSDHSAVASYDILLVSAPDRSKRPGTRLGYMTATAQPLTYDVHVFNKGSLTKTKRYTARLEDEAHLSFRSVKKGLRISPLVLFPHILRRGVSYVDNRQPDLDGCIRIYPRRPIKGQPRYL